MFVHFGLKSFLPAILSYGRSDLAGSVFVALQIPMTAVLSFPPVPVIRRRRCATGMFRAYLR